MKKVVFVGHRNLYFGAESVLFRVLTYLDQQHLAEPVVVLPKSVDTDFSKQLKLAHLYAPLLYSYKLIGGGLVRCLLCLVYNTPAVISLYFTLRKQQITAVYTNTSVNIVGPLLALVLGKPHIWHFHEQPTAGSFCWIPTGLFPLYRFLISRKHTVIVFISQIQKELWEKEFGIVIPNYKIIYTPPAWMPEPVEVIKSSATVTFGFLGSWTKSKNIHSLINCFSDLTQQYPERSFRLILMGGGEEELNIKKAIESKNLNNKVTLIPHSTKILPFFQSIDVFVLPSFFESWGLVALEAVSQRKAVILTANTGLTEVLKQNEDCIFVNPLNEKELYLAMEQLLLHPQFREKLAQNSFNTLKKLELFDQFENSIRSLFR